MLRPPAQNLGLFESVKDSSGTSPSLLHYIFPFILAISKRKKAQMRKDGRLNIATKM